MASRDCAGVAIDVNDEGFLTDHTQWTKELAAMIAQEEGIDELTDGHWKVIDFLQTYFKENDCMPTIRKVKKVGEIPTKEFYQLFPGGPLKKAAKIAGLPKPASCV